MPPKICVNSVTGCIVPCLKCKNSQFFFFLKVTLIVVCRLYVTFYDINHCSPTFAQSLWFWHQPKDTSLCGELKKKKKLSEFFAVQLDGSITEIVIFLWAELENTVMIIYGWQDTK